MEDVQIGFSVSKLSQLSTKLETARRARLYCETFLREGVAGQMINKRIFIKDIPVHTVYTVYTFIADPGTTFQVICKRYRITYGTYQLPVLSKPVEVSLKMNSL